jgi:hypothetical protein
MVNPMPKGSLVWTFALGIALAALSPQACAQQPPNRDDDADVKLPPVTVDRGAEAARSREWAAYQAQVDRWKTVRFGESSVLGGDLASKLAARIAEVEQSCALRDVERTKLELAGRGDIKRFLDRLEEIGREAGNQAIDPDLAQHRVTLELNTLDAWLAAGIFSKGSLYDKTLRGILPDGPDRALYEETLKRKNMARYRQAVREWSRTLQRGLKLSNRQCREISDLILAETVPPERFGQSDFAMVYYQLSSFPEDKLKPMLTDSQWKEVKQGIASWSHAKAFLNREGFEFARDALRPPTAQAPPSEPLPTSKPLAPERQ